MGDLSAFLQRAPKRIDDEILTAKVVKVAGGVMVVALDDDTRYPIGPCRGPEVEIGDVVLLVHTANDRPWIAQVDAQPEI